VSFNLGAGVDLESIVRSVLAGVMKQRKPEAGKSLDPKLISRIDTWGGHHGKCTVHEWLQHVATVADVYGDRVPDEQARVALAASHLRGLAAKRWKAQSEKLASEKKLVTWEAFSVALQSQHDGVIPAQKSRQFCLTFGSRMAPHLA